MSMMTIKKAYMVQFLPDAEIMRGREGEREKKGMCVPAFFPPFPLSSFLPLLVIALALTGCRGVESENPPIHPNLNMDFQERFDPQEANLFFEDERAMRQPVAGTVARGFLREDTRFYLGREENGGFIEEIPMPITMEFLERGQERYDIYCAVCHGLAGDGLGIVMTGNFGYTPAPTYHQDRLREVPDGYLYDVIVNGVRNMPSYAHQVPVADRWAIVAYIRALQRGQQASLGDVPADVVPTLEPVAPVDTTGGAEGDTVQTEAGAPDSPPDSVD